MKRLFFVLFCLSWSPDIGRTANMTSEMAKTVCPPPHFISTHLDNWRRDLHAILLQHSQTTPPIDYIEIPQVSAVHSRLDSKGAPICVYYDPRLASSMPLLVIHMKKVDLGTIKPPQPKLEEDRRSEKKEKSHPKPEENRSSKGIKKQQK